MPEALGAQAASQFLDMLFAIPKMALQKDYYESTTDYNTEKQKELFDYESNYNSPQEQMIRLAAAGLNPNLVYGGSAPAGTSGNVSVVPGQTPQLSYNTTDLVSSMLRLSQLKEVKADAQLKEAQANWYNKQSGRYDELMDATIQQMNANTDELAERLNVHRSDVRYKDAQICLSVAQEAYTQGQISLQEFEKQHLIAQTILYNKQGLNIDENTRIAKADAAITELAAKYEQLFYSDGRLKELTDADYKAAMIELRKTAEVAAADIHIEGNAVLRWINWITGQLGRILGGANQAGSAYRSFKPRPTKKNN